MSHLLLRKLARLATFSPEDLNPIIQVAMPTTSVGPDQDIVRQGEMSSACRVLVDGFACRYKLLSNGKRQITAFVIPGDICDLESFLGGRMDHSVGTLAPSTVAILPHKMLKSLIDAQRRLEGALWRNMVLEGNIAREWVVNVGRRPAHQRLAHLLCEMFTRLDTVGLSHAAGFDWPVTQTELADATGLSTVHVNRVLKDLRREGLVRWEGSTVVIPDREALTQRGEFDPAYLNP